MTGEHPTKQPPSTPAELYMCKLEEAASRELPFTGLLAEAQFLTEMLQTINVSDEEAEVLLLDINNRATKYTGRAKFSGHATFAEATLHDQDSEGGSAGSVILAASDSQEILIDVGPRREHDGLAVTFDGFRIISEPIEIDGEEITVARRVMLALTREPSDVEAVIKPDIKAYTGLAEVPGATFEFAGMSPEHARAWLSYYTPDVVDEIDTVVLNAPTSREAILALRDLTFSFPHPELAKKFENALDVYLDHIMDIDTVLPYILTVDEGEVIIEQDDAQSIGTINRAIYLGNLQRVLTWQTAISPDAPLALAPHIRVMIHKADSAEPSVHLVIPMYLILEVESVREQFYGITGSSPSEE